MSNLEPMENPDEKIQDALFERIIKNLTQLNGNISKVNEQLAEIEKSNEKTVLVGELWDTYTKNAEFHLIKTNKLDDPIKE